jgi:hypothetical protein
MCAKRYFCPPGATLLCTTFASLPINDLTEFFNALQLTPVKKILREDFHTLKIFRASMPSSRYVSLYSFFDPAPASASGTWFHFISFRVRSRGPSMVG